MSVPDRGYGKLDFQVNLNHELSSGQQKKDKHGTLIWNVYRVQEVIGKKEGVWLK